MKKKIKIFLIFVVSLYILYLFLGLFGILKVYFTPTTANEPNLKFNSYVIASNLVKPENKDFVCYNFIDSILGKHIRVHRLLGKEGDIIEIKSGVFFINDKNIDKDLRLLYNYQLTQQEFDSLKNNQKVGKNIYGTYDYKTNSYLIVLDEVTAISLGIKFNRLLKSKSDNDFEITSIYNNKWNKDFFGPLKIPKGKVFVMGDNRDNTFDSRNIGLINSSEIIGTIIYK